MHPPGWVIVNVGGWFPNTNTVTTMVTPQQAAAQWQQRQTKLLAEQYAKAWQQGANAYRTEQATPQHATPVLPTGGSLPAKPNATAMSRALGPAVQSLAQMAATIATIVPTAAQLATAGSVAAATSLAIKTYLASHAWRLAAGASVIWAGEHAGYAQTADADGQLISWELGPSANPCGDCPALAALPAMPLSWWPTLPGEGATECNVGCKCSVRAVAAPVPVLTGVQHELLSRIGNRQPVLIAA